MNLHKKVMILLGLACLFVTFVMVFFLFQGVTPRVPKMVKWSSVKSPGKAGDRLAVFLFPLLKESERVKIHGNSEFSKLFFKSFLKRARTEGIKTEIQRTTDDKEGFYIFIFQLRGSIFDRLCKGENALSFESPSEETEALSWKICKIRETALNQFNKKKRKSSVYWITMDRLEKDKAVLFFQSPLKDRRE